MSSELHKILQAREERAQKRSEILAGSIASVSLSLNIPSYPKHNALCRQVFPWIVEELKIHLLAHRVDLGMEEMITDKAGLLYLVAIEKSDDLKSLKNITESFESNHSVSRILDVDVYDEQAKPVSSGKKKPCIICKDCSAVECMREQRHDYEELRVKMFSMLEGYQVRHRAMEVSEKLSELCSRALLYEVSLSPKPGLVDYYDSGSHKDMNYYSFLNSTAALAPLWKDFALAAWKEKTNLSTALTQIRVLGLKAEQRMFSATRQVNTQKGLIFLLGIGVFSVSYLIKNNQELNDLNIRNCIREICQDLVNTELTASSKKQASHGEKTFLKYGIKGAGARYEAQEGFPVVFENALPFLEQHQEKLDFQDKEAMGEVLSQTLLNIISNTNDSNVLYRKGSEIAEKLKKLASEAIDKKDNYNKLATFCREQQISPGGSADMLAVTLFFYDVKQEID
ncbi:triphosphoribosyl-dephospho-CoA synthase [Lentimicrobium sp. S6]|uniref:triphosphoribosyl-dephospho-CoA synthase n=1 Tax=Lentimicrobium sp. S6 TaxID=2735872 RepID=UPI0015524165|nr:triphosphoribosyl-dephospho-CoA synthase [Lentimicrobium sp. S6]NPD45609.1 hypothetical protein [Lentimicrobium sp. S6]